MERIFKKDFKFSVESYEEYQNQKCISKGEIEADIYCHIIGSKAHFVITGMKGLDIDDEFSFNVDHPHSRILEPGGMVTSPRIQYMNDSMGTQTEPYICHLFCRFGQIITVRFAFADFNLSNGFPWPKRIYEFSGDMDELGELSEESKEILKKHVPDENVLALTYDKYCIMIETSDFNPFNIKTDIQTNQGLIWRSMTDDFEKEIKGLTPLFLQNGTKLNDVFPALILNHVETIFNRLGFVPKVWVDALINDMYSAVLRTPYSVYIKDIEEIKYAIYYCFTHR